MGSPASQTTLLSLAPKTYISGNWWRLKKIFCCLLGRPQMDSLSGVTRARVSAQSAAPLAPVRRWTWSSSCSWTAKPSLPSRTPPARACVKQEFMDEHQDSRCAALHFSNTAVLQPGSLNWANIEVLNSRRDIVFCIRTSNVITSSLLWTRKAEISSLQAF